MKILSCAFNMDTACVELKLADGTKMCIRDSLNRELKEKGYMTIAGRVNRKYFMEKFCYGGTERK